jgi:hypothetical protein
MTKALDAAVLGGRRAVGEPYFSVVLAFFNLVPAVAVVVAVELVSICILVHPEAAAARYIADGLKLALEVAAATAIVITAAQVIPGPPRWRALRQRAGIVNIAVVWPAVLVMGLIAYLQLPAGLHTCP